MRLLLMIGAIALLAVGPEAPAQELKLRATFKGHTGPVQLAAISPDGKLVVSAAASGRTSEMKLWETATGQEIDYLDPAPFGPSALAFSPDSKFLAYSSGFEGGITIWNVKTGKRQTTLQGRGDGTGALAFSQDASKLAAAGYHEFMVWDVGGAKEIYSRKVPLHGNSALAFSPDMKMVAVPNFQEIELHDAATGKELALLSEQRGRVNVLAFGNNGRLLVAASNRSKYFSATWSDTGEVKLWDIQTARERLTFQGDFGKVIRLAVSPDSKFVAVLDMKNRDADTEMKLLDTSTGHPVFKHKGTGRSLLTISYAPDGTLLLVESAKDKSVKLWELPPWKNNKAP